MTEKDGRIYLSVLLNTIEDEMQEKTDADRVPEIEKQGWEAEKLVNEAANEESDDIVKKIESEGRGDGTNETVSPSEKEQENTPS